MGTADRIVELLADRGSIPPGEVATALGVSEADVSEALDDPRLELASGRVHLVDERLDEELLLFDDLDDDL